MKIILFELKRYVAILILDSDRKVVDICTSFEFLPHLRNNFVGRLKIQKKTNTKKMTTDFSVS